jgi:formylglycine-generating enzyme required for sulfatase activity
VTRWISAAGSLLLLGSWGCSENQAASRDQWLIEIETDASVPPHGDRLLIEILDDSWASACDGCRHMFGAGNESAWPLTFGVLPPELAGRLHVRARLFRFDGVGASGLPTSKAVIDRVAILPEPDGLTRVSLALPMSCFGVPPDEVTRTSCNPATSTLEPETEIDGASPGLRPGDFAASLRQPCSANVMDGLRCVPGGVFVLGSQSYSDLTLSPSVPERLVQVKALWVDPDELTVAAFLELEPQLAEKPTSWGSLPLTVQNECTYERPGGETFPLNCFSFDLAEEICKARNMRLPTEVEWEYIASNAGRESQFPWGDADDICPRAIVARGRTGIVANPPENVQCRSIAGGVEEAGTVPGGDSDDTNDFGIANLAGNVAEWVRGTNLSYDECWGTTSQILVDPECVSPDAFTIRGGSWTNAPAYAHVAVRQQAYSGGGVHTGVRCVRDVD